MVFCYLIDSFRFINKFRNDSFSFEISIFVLGGGIFRVFFNFGVLMEKSDFIVKVYGKGAGFVDDEYGKGMGIISWIFKY